MDVAKIESRSLVPNRVTVEINQEIKDIVDEYSHALMTKADRNNGTSKEITAAKKASLSNNIPQSVIIKFILSKAPLMVNIDRLKIYQVITNLLNNSLKSITKKFDQLLSNDITSNENVMVVSVNVYGSIIKPYYLEKIDDMKDGESSTMIYDKSSISTGNLASDTHRQAHSRSKIKEYAIINVEDSGQGIDLGIIPTIFTKYGSLLSKGMGFRLYLAKRIAEGHGGTIWAQNEIGSDNKVNKRGAIFSFSLPVE